MEAAASYCMKAGQLVVVDSSLSPLPPLRRHSPPSSPKLYCSRLGITTRLHGSSSSTTHRRCSASVSSASSAAPPPPKAAAAASADEEQQQRPHQTKKERDLVFVAGATGRVGSRTVRELVKLGFRVRAAVRDARRADSLVQSVVELEQQRQLIKKKKQLDDDDGAAASAGETNLKVLEIVECDLEKLSEAGIVSAIGDAATVVCSVGASEKEILDVTGPYRIDYLATNKLVQAASAAKVEHFILVTSLGTNKIGFPAFLLNLFWGVLYWKRRAEEALIASGIPYTIIRPGGMERPTDAFKETHNLVVAPEDTYVGGLVSNLQVAELIAFAADNRTAAYCKVLEAVAETTAPLMPMDRLLAAVPSSSCREPPPLDEGEQEVNSATEYSDPTTTTDGDEAVKTEQHPL